jgi:4'-phosphopantetheinyl transferase EntD
MLAGLVPSAVTVAEVFDDRYDYGELLPQEAAAIERAVPKRRREFTAARMCAREALDRAGLPSAPVLRGSSGAPQWPPGVVGSLTHCDGYRACAVGRAGEVIAIGIDAEPHSPLPDGVLRLVAGAGEQERLALLGRSMPEIWWEKILFSAKESVYKAWSPMTGEWLGFEQADVEISPDGTFAARLLVPGPVVGGERLTAYRGRWLTGRGLIVTAVTVLPGQPPAPGC